MSIKVDSTSEYKSNKSSFRRDGSYRIFHITRKQKDESDDEENCSSKTRQDNEMNTKCQKKSFKLSNRNGLDGWKRKSTKKKRLLFLNKSSCESTSNEVKTPPLTNDLSSSIISKNTSVNHDKHIINLFELSESEALVDETPTQSDATLHDLLVRADQLETTVIKQEFNKIQPLSRTNVHRRRKRFLIACSTLMIVLIILMMIIIFIVIGRLRSRKLPEIITQTPSIFDV